MTNSYNMAPQLPCHEENTDNWVTKWI